MEIGRNSSKTVYLDIYGGSADATPTAVCKVNGNDPFTMTVDTDIAPEGVSQRFFTTVSMAHTQEDGPLLVTWQFDIDGVPVTKKDYFEVVTRYLTIAEVKAIVPGATTEQALDIESNVRNIIDSHTGQNFGHSVGVAEAYSDGGRSMKLPKRLISFTSVETQQYSYNPYAYRIVSDGWYLEQVTQSLQVIKEMPSDYSLDAGPVIITPYTSYWSAYRTGAKFAITGEWGYEYVPQKVKLAAKLLVDDYACNEVAYRDKYLESLKAADWRLQFSPESWYFTGNARADHLLSEYVILDWAVI